MDPLLREGDLTLLEHSMTVRVLKISEHLFYFLICLCSRFQLHSLAILFIGNYEDNPPINAVINAALKFFSDSKNLGKISENYDINAALDQIQNQDAAFIGPGEAFMEVIRTWPIYSSKERN